MSPKIVILQLQAFTHYKLRSTMMEKVLFLVTTLLILSIAVTSGHAQLREQQSKSSDLSGPVVKENSSHLGSWSNLFNMKMSHSYSMTFGSFGGNSYNINAYTNTMQFMFNEDLTGQVDISVLHSPFGNSFLNNSGNDFGGKIIIRNAELNYQLGERSHITIRYQQQPFHGLSPFSPYRNNPFGGINY